MIWTLRYTSPRGHHLYIDDDGRATDQRALARTFPTEARANEFAAMRNIPSGYRTRNCASGAGPLPH
jgi:hypothetical protein